MQEACGGCGKASGGTGTSRCGLGKEAIKADVGLGDGGFVL